MCALVSLLKQARYAGGEVVMMPPKEAAAYRILSLTCLDHVFAMVSTVEEAITKFKLG